ncbi:MAG: TldD/PmbA family protein [Candidatus Hydrothermarchaeota archaeon]
MDDLLISLIDKIQDRLEYVDIRYEKTIFTNITIKDDEEKITNGIESGIGIRTFNKGNWGFSSTNDISNIEEIAENAVKLALHGRNKRKTHLAEAEVNRKVLFMKPKIDPREIDISEKVDCLKMVIDTTKEFSEIVNSNASYLDRFTERMFVNSENSFIKTSHFSVSLYTSVVARDGEKVQVGTEKIGHTGGFELLKEENLKELGKRASKKAINMLYADHVSGGKYPIVMSGKLTGVFIHEALGHACEADLVLQDNSVLKGRIGERIADDSVTIYDDPTLENKFGSFYYDSEGVKARKTYVVKDGILKEFLHSRETAFLMQREPNGKARSQGYSHPPLVRMSNMCLEPKDWKFDEIIEETKFGIYVDGSRGGQVDTGSGIFQFNAEEAFLIEKGEIKQPLRDVSFSGNVLDTLKNIDAIGDTIEFSIGVCGKSGQGVPVGDGGPKTRLSSVLIGGR